MAEHTPGPWTMETPLGEGTSWGVRSPDATRARYICFTYQEADAEANARLIAASPDLKDGCLEALAFARFILEWSGGTTAKVGAQELIERLEAVLRKAEVELPALEVPRV